MTGKAVYCDVCGKRKAPRGRSIPIPLIGNLCDSECPGYYEEPKVGSLWPGETSEEFGYEVSG